MTLINTFHDNIKSLCVTDWPTLKVKTLALTIGDYCTHNITMSVNYTDNKNAVLCLFNNGYYFENVRS